MKNQKLRMAAGIATAFFFVSCSNNKAETTQEPAVKDVHVAARQTNAENKTTEAGVQDGSAIATLETSDFILKVHKAIPFTLKPKSYEPFKVDPSTKLVVLDISVRNKLSTPLNFSRILGMTELRGNGGKNLVAPWVVAAYEVDYPEPNHQKEYNALWSSSFEPNGFHRSILIGMNPDKEEKKITLIVPEKADFNSPSRKSVQFTTE